MSAVIATAAVGLVIFGIGFYAALRSHREAQSEKITHQR
jgi:hypothetical protein